MNIHQDITNRILTAMKSGTLPWIKPWSSMGSGAMPRNAITQRAYSGCNVPLLWLTAQESGYASNLWATYQQAKAAGGQVRGGSKATRVVYAATFEKESDAGKVEHIPFLKAFSVFNIAQIDGLESLQPKPAPVNPETRDAQCDEFLRLTMADIRHGEGRAYYRPEHDFIMLPPFETFNSASGYYATALHELTHWTKLERRCNRGFENKFGTEAYAMEELVAELGAAFMCAEFGYDATTQHAAYIQSWIKLLEGNPRAFVTAASKASAAVEYLRRSLIAEPMAIAA